MSNHRDRRYPSCINLPTVLASLAAWGLIWLAIGQAYGAEPIKAGDVCRVTYHDGTERRAVVQQFEPQLVRDGQVWVSVDDERFVFFIARYRLEDLRECTR